MELTDLAEEDITEKHERMWQSQTAARAALMRSTPFEIREHLISATENVVDLRENFRARRPRGEL